MAEPSYETLFGSCVLELAVPDTSVGFPENVVGDDWLASLKAPQVDRKQAFFEVGSNSRDAENSPGRCSPTFVVCRTGNTEAAVSPSVDFSTINTHPHPVDNGRRQKRSPEQSGERFSLIFSESQGIWVAIYEFTLDVSFLRLPFSDPLLCLTTSVTLRERALSLSTTTHPLIAFLQQEALISLDNSGDTSSQYGTPDDGEPGIGALEEVNLLDGLAIGSSLSPESDPMYLPSTRLGNMSRRQLFSLPPISPFEPTSVEASTKRGPHHVLRKSFRKTLRVTSGFRVRMRTVFVPHVLLPKDNILAGTDNDQDSGSDFEGGNEEREAGNNERTVVLCVEVENSGESGPDIGFSLERVNIKIGGEGATARLIGWGECPCDSKVEERIFPLPLGPMEQYNLLYVVSFLSVINDRNDFSLTVPPAKLGVDLQRAVTIKIHGRPYFLDTDRNDVGEDFVAMSYPTQSFSSRWNCVLDLSPRPREDLHQMQKSLGGAPTALPEPPSPFPGTLSSVFVPPITAKPGPQAVAGKRLVIPSNVTALRAINPGSHNRLSLPPRDQSSSPIPTNQSSYGPPSAVLHMSSGPQTASGFGISETHTQSFVTPPTPTYPALLPSASVSNTQGLGSQQGFSRPSTEFRSERHSGTGPHATVGKSDTTQEALASATEPIIISAGLIPGNDSNETLDQMKIYPSMVFSLDIFVFNQSSWTRRFEVSCPDVDRSQHGKVEESASSQTNIDELSMIGSPGILPLQNRVRVGPLRPSTCQSVRLDFLALSPGIHSIKVLTLTDVETGYSMHLRSVMDIVVHEREGECIELHR
ncbi:hypothetical protein ID866_1547 [Astraeus odoratus]|nr:hypothetical protein ID866_1547 [Astraeus odoratus]